MFHILVSIGGWFALWNFIAVFLVHVSPVKNSEGKDFEPELILGMSYFVAFLIILLCLWSVY